MAFYSFYWLTIIQLLVCVSSLNSMKLKSIHLVFRHGDRTPTKSETYKTDPYRKDNFYPIGRGGLTNRGKQRAYDFGKSLREKYDDFLGDYYWPADVKFLSTDMGRTKMSLQYLLAGLYPPKNEQIWNEKLNWQVIPIDHVSSSRQLHHQLRLSCPTAKAEKKCIKKNSTYLDKQSQFKEFKENLTKLMDLSDVQLKNVFNLYHNLKALSSMNLTVPEWTKPYFPEGLIVEATLLYYERFGFNNQIKKLFGGMHLKTIIDDIDTVIYNENNKKKPKLHIHSVHESNIAAILQTLGLWKRVIPEYTSGILFELYESDSQYFIKIFYYKGIPAEYEQQQLPGCDYFCPYETFLNITRDVVPVDVESECFYFQQFRNFMT